MCCQDLFEPYVIVQKTAHLPPFRQQFEGYGMNKISFAMEVRVAHELKLMLCVCLCLCASVCICLDLYLSRPLSVSLCVDFARGCGWTFTLLVLLVVLQLHAAGYQFVVLANAWLLHLPHPVSSHAHT